MLVFYLIIVLLLLFVASSIFITVMRGYIPPIPSSKGVRAEILKQIQKMDLPAACIAEIGCGYGVVLFQLARRFPKAQMIGFEVAFTPYLFCRICQIIGRFKNVRLIYGDAFEQMEKRNLTVDIGIVYLINTPVVIQQVENLYQKHIKQTLIVNSYPLKMYKPIRVVGPLDIFKSKLYLYKKQNDKNF